MCRNPVSLVLVSIWVPASFSLAGGGVRGPRKEETACLNSPGGCQMGYCQGFSSVGWSRVATSVPGKSVPLPFTFSAGKDSCERN